MMKSMMMMIMIMIMTAAASERHGIAVDSLPP
jgi:hypothetical protein